jgi:hypothetical protein
MGIGLVAGGTALPSGVVVPADASPVSEGNVVATGQAIAVSVIQGAPEADPASVAILRAKLGALSR